MSLYDDVVLADGPAGYWPCFELSGTTTYDLSGNARNGTYQASPNPTLASITGPGLDARAPYYPAAGQSDITDNSAFSGAGASGVLTAECWAWVPSLPGAYMCMVGKGNVANYEWTLGMLTGGPWFSQFTTSNESSSSLVQSPGKAATQRWYHLVGIWDRANSYHAIWVNGRRDATAAPAFNMTDGTANLRIGNRADASGTPNASICRAAVYSKVLDGCRIMAHYRAGLASPRPRRHRLGR